MGYHVALMADSTSRWAEAVREVAGRLREMPGEEGYPAYLNTRLAAFYERAGAVKTLGREPRLGSITVIGAVSPPGGDFSEPVTRDSLRQTAVFWALDSDLAHRRHFPAINWTTSYSLFEQRLQPWFVEHVGADWPGLRDRASSALQQEAELQEIVQLVGADALSATQRLTLWTGQTIRDVFLQQSAIDPIDAYCEPAKQAALLRTVLAVSDELDQGISAGANLSDLVRLDAVGSLGALRWENTADIAEHAETARAAIRAELQEGSS